MTVAPPYDRALREFYRSQIQHVDFHGTRTRDLINEFVRENSGHVTLTEEFDGPGPESRLVAVDAVNLGAQWAFPFQEENTFAKGLFFSPTNQR